MRRCRRAITKEKGVILGDCRQCRGAILRHFGQGWVNLLPDAPGAQDWPAILRAGNRLGYDGLITVIASGWSAARREAVARHAADCIRRWWATAP